jgi:hypothetical protein
MHRTLLVLWLLGAAIYAGFSFVPPPHQPLIETAKHADRAALPAPKTTAPRRTAAPQAPAVAEQTTPTIPPPTAPPAGTASDAETDTADEEPQTAVPDQPPSSSGLAQEDPPQQEELHQDYGEVSRSAPVHSGPAVDSEVVGYATAGAPVELVERRDGWMKVIDPSTRREGWISESYVTPTGRRDGIDEGQEFQPLEEAAVAPPDDAALSEPQQPKRSIKSKRGKKHFGSKRKRFKFAKRFRRR